MSAPRHLTPLPDPDIDDPSEPDGRLGVLGRPRGLAELTSALRGAGVAEGPVRLITGAPGSGTTRLARDFTLAAEAMGARVVWGYCSDDAGAPRYWPWTQVVRSLLGRTRGTDLAGLVLEDAAASDRFELFDAVAATVGRAAELRPLVLVLDDLHHADAPSLQLTQFVARHLQAHPLVLVATMRPVETWERASERAGAVATVDALRRLGGEIRLGEPGVRGAAEVPRGDHDAQVRAITTAAALGSDRAVMDDPSPPADAPCAVRADPPRVNVLGAFEVVSPDGTPARWTSRKARELLKILVSRRGVPLTRETLMDMLWPGEDPAVLGNRLSVALSTVRRALDPERRLDPDQLVTTASDSVRLRLDVVEVDVERFLADATAVLDAHRHGEPPDVDALDALVRSHRGEALPDEPHAEWAAAMRDEVRTCYIALARLLAAEADLAGDHLRAAAAHRRVLDADPYDEHSSLGIVSTFDHMGAHGQADAAYATYLRRMDELGVPAAPDPRSPLLSSRCLAPPVLGHEGATYARPASDKEP